MQNGLVHAAIGADDKLFRLSTLCLTYVIAIPYAAFARELLGAGWKRSLSVWLWIEVAFAPITMPIAIFAHSSHWTDVVNGILIIGGTILILLHVILLRRTPESFEKGLTWPLIVFAILVLLTNRGFRLAGFDVEPIGFLILLAGLGATASRRAVARERKLTEVEQELATARRIQTSIIPHSSPHVSRLRVATRYQPMTSVAGDFYDFLKTDGNSLTILVADVSGHGVPAALVASMLKVCFAAQQEQANNPAGILAGLNTMLRGTLGGQYVTAACAAIDLTANSVTYAGAGHPPALLLQKNRSEVIPLAENGLFIGPFAHAMYSNMSVPFERGDKLLLYTDGIIEATGADGHEFGQQSLVNLLLKTKDLEPAEFIEQLFQNIATPAQQDDLTAVVTQFVSEAPTSR